MDAVTAIATSLALGAGAVAGRTLLTEAVKDAYAALKAAILGRAPTAPIAALEEKPASQPRRAAVAEDLAEAGAADDAELARLAGALLAAVRAEAPQAAEAIGVDLVDVEAASLRVTDIAATGTGVKVEGGRFSGDIVIEKVRAGTRPASDEPEG